MMAKDLKLYFVLPSHCEDELGTSESMKQAFELCCQNQIIPDWISEVEAASIQFVKTDVIVFEKFEGSAFEKVRELKCLLAGPWCLISCLLEGLQVPNNRSPVYTMAMNNLVVTASAYPQEKKIRIKEKVELMGGIFTLNVTNNLTHLITDSVRTQKYEVANFLNKAVMLESWIAAVWKESCVRNVKATDDEFLKYKCPIFQNLRVCCTGFDPQNRNTLQELVCKNGGRYSGKLVTSATDILICNPNSRSEKFEVAKKSKIPCVKKEWVFDSVKKGYSIPEKDYVINISSSTPTKTFNATWDHNFSMMSMISIPENAENANHYKTSASETIDMSLYNMDATSQSRKPSTSKAQKENEIPDVIDSIDLQQVKNAGTFLDGCGVYLVGFSPNRREKMIRILKTAGATRYDEISDRVTQIVVGDPASNEMKALNAKGCGLPMVSVKWIVESMKKQEPAHEDAFAITCTKNTTLMPSSPLSKKGLTLLQNETTLVALPPVPKFDLGAEEEEDPIQMYRNKTNEEDTLARLLMQSDVNSKLFRSNNEPKPVETPKRINETSLGQEEEGEEILLPVFEGKTFRIIDHTAEDVLKLNQQIEALGGQIVPLNFRAVTDYVVVPTTCNAVKHTATEVVNTLYVPNCLQDNQKLTIEYYHQPIYDTYNNKPLTGCVITLSGFIFYERTFLILLIQHLGALYQDKLARMTTPISNVLGSTHLICLEPTGSKYSAAVRWNIPVLRREWILKCLATGTKYEESGVFALGMDIAETNPPPKMSLSKYKIENHNKSLTTENQNKPQTTENTAQNIKNERASVAKNVTPHNHENINDTKRKSPLETKDEKTKEVENDHDTSQTKKLKADETDFANAPCSQDDYFSESHIPENLMNLDVMDQPGSPVIVVEGRAVPLKTYMKELRDQGLFDTPSPARKLEGTPHEEIIARLRKRVPVKNSGRTALKSCDGGGSQGTPVGKYLRGLQERNVLPKSPKSGPSRNSFGTPDNAYLRIGEVKTPDTPLGRFLGEDEPSRETRKHWQKYVEQIPVYNCHTRPPVSHPRRPSTPYSEVKKQAWAWLLRNKDGKEDGGEKNPNKPSTSKNVEKDVAPEETESQQVTNQIGQFQDIIKKRNSSTNGRSSLLKLDGTPQKQNDDGSSKIAFRVAKNSQADTVDWDEPIENGFDGQVTENTTDFRHRKFMMSALDTAQKASISNTIKSLGGEVSDQPAHYDDSATHVICMNPTRNEKVLSCMASGKWVVHPDFVQKSGEQGRFLSEELYEFGNPLAVSNLSFVTTTAVTEAIHWWRKRFEKTKKGAFSSLRALIFAKNRPAVVRLIQAGQGVVVQAEPPFDHSLDVTHCFIDLKMKIDFTQFIPLTEQGILCLSILYLSNYLNNLASIEEKDYIIPDLRDYYK